MQTSTHTHTPGPWTINHERIEAAYGDIALICDPQSIKRGLVVSWPVTDGDPLPGDREAAANARLIAAAPAMLDALRSLFREHIMAAHGDDHALYVTEYCPICNEARAAIAAATGEDA